MRMHAIFLISMVGTILCIRVNPMDSDERQHAAVEEHVDSETEVSGETNADVATEIPANHDCNGDEFRCRNGTCIPKVWACDGAVDCVDGSDEIECVEYEETSECPGDLFKCSNGGCIQREWVCDQEADCTDGSDEMECQVESRLGDPDSQPGMNQENNLKQETNDLGSEEMQGEKETTGFPVLEGGTFVEEFTKNLINNMLVIKVREQEEESKILSKKIENLQNENTLLVARMESLESRLEKLTVSVPSGSLQSNDLVVEAADGDVQSIKVVREELKNNITEVKKFLFGDSVLGDSGEILKKQKWRFDNFWQKHYYMNKTERVYTAAEAVRLNMSSLDNSEKHLLVFKSLNEEHDLDFYYSLTSDVEETGKHDWIYDDSWKQYFYLENITALSEPVRVYMSVDAALNGQSSNKAFHLLYRYSNYIFRYADSQEQRSKHAWRMDGVWFYYKHQERYNNEDVWIYFPSKLTDGVLKQGRGKIHLFFYDEQKQIYYRYADDSERKSRVFEQEEENGNRFFIERQGRIEVQVYRDIME